MKRIFVASAWRADTEAGQEANRQRAEEACRSVALAGHAPFAPHLLFTRFLDDAIPEERQIGITAGLAFLEKCDELWAYGSVTEGMQGEIEEAMHLGIPVRFC